MNRRIRFCAAICACMVAMLLGSMPAGAAEILDRIVASVNGRIILQSDWEDAVRCEAFIAGRGLDQVSFKDRKAALDRLIDQELLREQMRGVDFPPVTEAELTASVAEVRKLYPEAVTLQGWHDALTQSGLTETALRDRLTLQLNLLRLVETRLRPAVDIDAQSIEHYYNQELLPQLRQAGGKDVGLEEVTPKIKELLTEQKVSELLTSWLQNLRAGSDIHTMSDASDSESQVQ